MKGILLGLHEKAGIDGVNNAARNPGLGMTVRKRKRWIAERHLASLICLYYMLSDFDLWFQHWAIPIKVTLLIESIVLAKSSFVIIGACSLSSLKIYLHDAASSRHAAPKAANAIIPVQC